MINLEKLSKYQQVYQNGKIIKDWEYARSNKRIGMIDWKKFKGKDVLDLGCNNGMFCLEAKRRGANRVIGIDNDSTSGPCIDGARQLAEDENLNVEFWKVNYDSREFLYFAPVVHVMFCFSVLRWTEDSIKMLEFIDMHTKDTLYFESNAGKEWENQIDMVKKYTSFSGYIDLGVTETNEKRGYHRLWECSRTVDDISQEHWNKGLITWVPIERITEWSVDHLGDPQIDTLEFQELKDNIKINGFRKPIILKRLNTNKPINQCDYRCVHGAHRFIALKELGWKEMPCRIMLDDIKP